MNVSALDENRRPTYVEHFYKPIKDINWLIGKMEKGYKSLIAKKLLSLSIYSHIREDI